MSRFSLMLFISGLALGVSSCGLKGDLYLPEKNPSSVIITAPPHQSSSSSSSTP